MMQSNARRVYIMFMVLALGLALVAMTSPSGGNQIFVAADKKGVDILFLKGKFILKDKKGSIVISDDKKCECGHPHYFKK